MKRLNLQAAICAAVLLAMALPPAEANAGGKMEKQAMESAPSETETLSARQQAIPLIGAAMAAGNMPALDAALNRGLDAGLTLSEAKEILIQLYAYAGFPRSLNALAELEAVADKRKKRGIDDAPGREPSRPAPTGEELLAAGKVNQTKIAGRPVEGGVFTFAPAVNQFLQTHLFGDIFERDNLDWQSRELATIGALAAMPGVEAQLRAHLQAGLHVGLSAAQLRQIAEALDKAGEAAAGRRVAEALAQAPAAGGR